MIVFCCELVSLLFPGISDKAKCFTLHSSPAGVGSIGEGQVVVN